MAWYPLANVLHHKLSSALSALGIGIGVCMMITLTGLTRGSLYEVARRWESVHADLIVYPKLRQDVSMLTGAGLSDQYERVLPELNPGTVAKAAPVFFWRMKLAGQDQTVAGVRNKDLSTVSGGAAALAGQARFTPRTDWETFWEGMVAQQRADWVEKYGSGEGFLPDPRPEQLAKAGWMQLIIDDRLARAGGFRVDQEVTAAGHIWQIVGIVPAGGLARVYMPRRTAQLLFAGGAEQSTVLFVTLTDQADLETARADIAEQTGQKVAPLSSYRALLEDKFGVMFLYIDVVNVLAMAIAFLFIMITLYTMVLQRTRDIAILKSSGASSGYILRQVLTEALLLTGTGAVLGVALSYLAGWAIQQVRPLLTVEITLRWVLTGLACAIAGAVLSALYPAWRATRVDMISALSYE